MKKMTIPKRVLVVLLIVAAIGWAGVGFLGSRPPLKVSCTAGREELIVAPGLFYTLDGHQAKPIHVYDTVLETASDSGPEYRFHVISERGLQWLTIDYHDFMGKEGHAKFQVWRDGTTGTITLEDEFSSLWYTF